MSHEDIKTAPAGELGANLKTESNFIKSTANFQPPKKINRKSLAKSDSGLVVVEPAINANHDLKCLSVETCEGAFNKWGNPNCDGYYYKEDGSLWIADENGKESLVSPSYIRVIALSRTLESSEWHARVEFNNLDGIKVTRDIPRSTLLHHMDPLKNLAAEGCPISYASRESLLTYLRAANPTERIRQIKKTGWINDNEYICPSFQITSPNNQETYELPGTEQDPGYGQKGTLVEWQERVAAYCAGNHILTFALCTGLSGPLLKLFPNVRSTIINLFGKTSTGKTTALLVAASLWGNPKKYTGQWRNTDNNLESVFELYNDSLCVLDELSQVNAKKLSEIAYMAGNEKGKGRCKADTSSKRRKEWKTSILSSGELTLEDKLREAGLRAKGGQQARFVDIGARVSDEDGVFNVLRGFNSGADLSKHLQEQSAKYYGVAAHEFVKRLVENKFSLLGQDLQTIYEAQIKALCDKFGLSNADGEVQRVGDVFALPAIVGVLAVGYEVFPADLNILESVKFVFNRWLQDRGGKKNVEDEKIVQHVMDFLMQHSARFMELRNGETEENRTTYNLLGYFQKENNKTTYYLILKSFKEEICENFSDRTIRDALKKKGVLITELENNGRERDPRKRINGENPRRFVTIVVKNDYLEEVDSNKAVHQEIEST